MKKETSMKINYFYNTLYQVITLIVPLITTPYLSKVLGAKGIGLYSYSYSIAYYFVLFAMLGLGNYGRREIAFARRDREYLSKVFWSIYFLQVFTSLIAIIAYIIYLIALDDNYMMNLMIIYVVSAVFDISWLFLGLELFRYTVFINSIVKILATLCIFVFVHNASDVYIYGLIMALHFLVSSIAMWKQLRNEVDFYLPSFSEIIAHLKPNIILFIPVIAVSLYKTMDKIMLGAISGTIEVGYYENAERIIRVPVALISSLGTVMMPKISVLLSQGKKEESNSYIGKSLYFSMFISTSTCFGIMGISKEFVPLFYGNHFLVCIKLFLVLLPSCIFVAFSQVLLTQILLPQNHNKSYAIIVSLGAAVNMVVNLILIPKYKSVGAAIGTLAAEMIVCIANMVINCKRFNSYKFFLKGIPFINAGFLMFLFLFLVEFTIENPIIILVIKILLGILMYIIFLVVTIFLEHKMGIDDLMVMLKQIIQSMLKSRKR